jgi:hypothetical protein
MKLPGRKLTLSILSGLLLGILFPVWLFYGPFFPRFPARTDATAILKRNDPKQMLQAANRLSWLFNWPKATPPFNLGRSSKAAGLWYPFGHTEWNLAVSSVSLSMLRQHTNDHHGMLSLFIYAAFR